MQPTQKVPIVLATLLFILAAAAEIATSRSRLPQDDAVAPLRVESAHGRLLESASSPTRATF
jgi:hypothetical protein